MGGLFIPLTVSLFLWLCFQNLGCLSHKVATLARQNFVDCGGWKGLKQILKLPLASQIPWLRFVVLDSMSGITTHPPLTLHWPTGFSLFGLKWPWLENWEGECFILSCPLQASWECLKHLWGLGSPTAALCFDRTFGSLWVWRRVKPLQLSLKNGCEKASREPCCWVTHTWAF